MKIIPENISKLTLSKTQNVENKQKTEIDKNSRLWKAVQDFKSTLIYHMLKSMRSTIGQSELTEEAPGKDFFMGMFDEKVSQLMAHQQYDSMSEILYRQLTGENITPSTDQKPNRLPFQLNNVQKEKNETAIKSEKMNSNQQIGSTYHQNNLMNRLNKYSSVIEEAAEKYNVDKKLIYAVIAQESSGNPDVVSNKGATGLMQLMEETAKDMGVKDINNPRENILGGTKYLRLMLDRFNGDSSLALAGYNAGPSAVEKYDGIPPYKETQNYVKKVQQYYDSFKKSELL